MLRPLNYNLNLIYRCPQCKTPYWFSKSEINKGLAFICCGSSHKLAGISDIRVRCYYNQDIDDKVISILRSYGYTLEQIKSIPIEANSTEDYVKQFLASQK